MFAICIATLCQRDIALRSLDRCKAKVSQLEGGIDFLETLVILQENGYDILDENLQETNDLWVEANNILIGRIDKITSAFHVHVMELLAEIERLKGELHLCRFSFPPNKIPDDLEPTCQ
jgi:hypothetical protein